MTIVFALRPSLLSYVSIFFPKINRKQMSEAGTAYPSGVPDFLSCILVDYHIGH